MNREEWVEKVLKPALARAPERKPSFETPSGIPLHVVHAPSDAHDLPGLYPFTRGIHPTMYRSRLWTMRQYAGFSTAQETNARFRYLLSQGQMGLSVAFDLPTQLCMDADDPLATGEVGKVGVSISTLDDMRELFAGIPLEKVSTSMTINAPAAVLLALYIAVAKEQAGAEADAERVMRNLRGTVQNDILKEYAARGLYIFPPRPSMRLVTDVFAFCKQHMPHWNTISISGYHIREAGSTAVQEVAFTLANAIAYVQAALEAGLDVDEFAGQLTFFFNAHNDFLEEIAKFRAARRLWARIMRERFGAKDPRSWMLRFHAQTGGSTLTAQQPMNNVVRVTIQALAAVLGGAQSLHTNSWDEALQLPTEESVRLALRTQQIIAYESGVTDTVDPLGGAYAIEYLTDEIERRALALIETIDALGGAVRAIETGWMQAQIAESAYRYQRQVERGERVIVGVNAFNEDGGASTKVERFRVDPAIEERQRARLAAWRANRDNERVGALLAQLEQAARGTANLMPVLIACVEGGVTVGEIGRVLRRVFGEYQPPQVV
ncbi:MAG: methylmalonyl-CoA mutase family protein [Anaerolineae bacterium]|nr:methylmalonyl-CoA mutase family protein [Thermoflexales bacterium]MDW8054865.1 methylmalonyl-CoA mutase family protein [Anaerolineae bacterium]MDW8293161.1 methylmalonyl-CoA mutase family protein [Anaerolineae bacterium]